MKTCRLTAAALAAGGLLAFGAAQLTPTAGTQASAPAVSTPVPAHQATEMVFPGFYGHPIFGYNLLGYSGEGSAGSGGSYPGEGANHATLTGFGGLYGFQSPFFGVITN